MDLSKMPIWLAYVAAPLLVLLLSGIAILNSENPFLIAAMMLACGLLSAAALHGYVAVKKRFTKDK